ncbi:MAG TPA: hypothetical protein VLK85_23060 [Ramlibacter sp.]|nr:hypothetical protein [Ramlibacter sp.]
MTTIAPTRQAAAQLLRTGVAAARPHPHPRQAAAAGPAASNRSQGWQVPPAAIRRIAAIARDAPDRRQQAVRIFLESVLLRELGDSLVHDPAFSGLVDAVQRQLQDDADLAAAADRLGQLLLSA